jgi:hypothetical protein
MWMRYLQLQNWETIGFSGFGQRHLAWWFFAGFTQNFGNQLPGATETATEVTEKVLSWLGANGTTQNWFMHVNYWDVHHPYAAPQKFFDQVRTVAIPARLMRKPSLVTPMITMVHVRHAPGGTNSPTGAIRSRDERAGCPKTTRTRVRPL